MHKLHKYWNYSMKSEMAIPQGISHNQGWWGRPIMNRFMIKTLLRHDAQELRHHVANVHVAHETIFGVCGSDHPALGKMALS